MKVLLLVLSLLTFGLVSPPAAQAAERTYTYTVETRGPVTTDAGAFAEMARATLTHSSGWSLGGGIRFEPVNSGGSVRLILATPAEVDAAAPGCSAQWSCRVGEQVLINENRWNTGTSSWTGTLHDYRHYVINHEVGHWLGLGHSACPGRGAPAPVMQQQSISLGGCVATTWPLPSEKATVAQRHGVWSYFTDRGSLLRGDELMVAGERLTSPSHRYRADMQADGNFVVYQGSRVLWHSGTYGHPNAHVVMQSDGNLVVYAPTGRPLWHSGTHGTAGARVALQDDGNLVVYAPGNAPLWHIGPDRG